MRLALFSLLLALLAVCAMAAPQHKSVIVSYQDDTPDHILAQAKHAIEKAGGTITHEFNKLIKGFAANAPAKILDAVQAWGAEYNAVIEEDQVVHALGDGH